MSNPVGFDALSARLDDVVVELDFGNDLEPAHRKVLQEAVSVLRTSVGIRWHAEEVKRILDEGLAHMNEMDKRHEDELDVLRQANSTVSLRCKALESQYTRERQEKFNLERSVERYKQIARDATEAQHAAERALHRRVRQEGLNALRPWTD